jgi:hypothetical protein
MTVHDPENDLELAQIIATCYSQWRTAGGTADTLICYSWLLDAYHDRFACGFHQSKLANLARLGFLRRVDATRGGHRCYYRLADQVRVEAVLDHWGLN